MQMNPGMGTASIAYNHLFHENRTTNRLELITDFTENTDVEIIASLKVLSSPGSTNDYQCTRLISWAYY